MDGKLPTYRHLHRHLDNEQHRVITDKQTRQTSALGSNYRRSRRGAKPRVFVYV